MVGLSRLFIGWVACALCALSGFEVQAQKRVALLVGNAAYAAARLANPVNDATDLASALKARGFETVVALNSSQPDFNECVRVFADKITPGAVALF